MKLFYTAPRCSVRANPASQISRYSGGLVNTLSQSRRLQEIGMNPQKVYIVPTSFLIMYSHCEYSIPNEFSPALGGDC